MPRCDHCREEFRDLFSSWDYWLDLVHTVQTLETEEAITAATAEKMLESLQWFKKFAMEDSAPDAIGEAQRLRAALVEAATMADEHPDEVGRFRKFCMQAAEDDG